LTPKGGLPRQAEFARTSFFWSVLLARQTHLLLGKRDGRQELARNFGRWPGVRVQRCPQRPLPERTTPLTVERTAKCVAHPAVRLVNSDGVCDGQFEQVGVIPGGVDLFCRGFRAFRPFFFLECSRPCGSGCCPGSSAPPGGPSRGSPSRPARHRRPPP
jgi:hypothetical protein